MDQERRQQASDMPWDGPSSRAHISRTQGTRERAMRVTKWKEPSTLPEPEPRPGLVHRWIRISALNNADNLNAHNQLTQGWTPCRMEDYSELHLEVDPSDNRFAAQGNVVTGGLMLCCMPEEVAQQRIDHYENMNRNQIRGIDAHYLRENDARMPLLRPDRKLSTTYGRG